MDFEGIGFFRNHSFFLITFRFHLSILYSTAGSLTVRTVLTMAGLKLCIQPRPTRMRNTSMPQYRGKYTYFHFIPEEDLTLHTTCYKTNATYPSIISCPISSLGVPSYHQVFLFQKSCLNVSLDSDEL